MNNWWQYIKSILGLQKTSQNDIQYLERMLLQADFGNTITKAIIADWQKILATKTDHSPEEMQAALKKVLENFIIEKKATLIPGETISLWGVNGVGKTTTCAKIANLLQKQGNSVMLGACDTFRAAATEQLIHWAKEINCQIVAQHSNADPASVAYDALNAQISRRIDFCILDTTGQIIQNHSLKAQSQKIIRVLQKLRATAPEHRWLVLDANLGQNSINHAKDFLEAININGLVISKFDGTSKAGFLAHISQEFKLPIYYIGTGEKIENIEEFSLNKYLTKIIS